MLYLILAILSSMMINVLMRLSEKHSRHPLSMLAVNYLTCGALAVLFSGSLELFPKAEGLPVTLLLGAVTGVLFLASFLLLRWNVEKNGVVLSATFMKLGVLVPTLMSILVFRETPRLFQVLGIAAAVVAILIIQGKGGAEENGSSLGLVVLLVSGGLSDAMSKVYEELGAAALKDQFLLYTFGMALILCIVLCLVKKQPLKGMDALFGLLIGIPNYLSARFLLLALGQLPAVVVYPSFSVGTIVLVTLAGVLFFGEKLNRRKGIALGIILCALILLNL